MSTTSSVPASIGRNGLKIRVQAVRLRPGAHDRISRLLAEIDTHLAGLRRAWGTL